MCQVESWQVLNLIMNTQSEKPLLISSKLSHKHNRVNYRCLMSYNDKHWMKIQSCSWKHELLVIFCHKHWLICTYLVGDFLTQSLPKEWINGLCSFLFSLQFNRMESDTAPTQHPGKTCMLTKTQRLSVRVLQANRWVYKSFLLSAFQWES